MPNGGLQVVRPSAGAYDAILRALRTAQSTAGYDFADQSLLAVYHPLML